MFFTKFVSNQKSNEIFRQKWVLEDFMNFFVSLGNEVFKAIKQVIYKEKR
jgi:hypothetical protein